MTSLSFGMNIDDKNHDEIRSEIERLRVQVVYALGSSDMWWEDRVKQHKVGHDGRIS